MQCIGFEQRLIIRMWEAGNHRSDMSGMSIAGIIETEFEYLALLELKLQTNTCSRAGRL